MKYVYVLCTFLSAIIIIIVIVILYTDIYSIFLGRDSITTKHRHKYALTLLLLNVHPHFELMTSPSKHHLSSLLAPSFDTSPHHRVPQETYSFQPPKNTDFFPAIWHILSSSRKKNSRWLVVEPPKNCSRQFGSSFSNVENSKTSLSALS